MNSRISVVQSYWTVKNYSESYVTEGVSIKLFEKCENQLQKLKITELS